jgi:predicted nucleotide-binding protein
MTAVEKVIEGIDQLRKDLADIIQSTPRDENLRDAKLKTFVRRVCEQLAAWGLSTVADQDFGSNSMIHMYGAGIRSKLIDDGLSALRGDMATHPEHYSPKLAREQPQSVSAKPTAAKAHETLLPHAPALGSPESRSVWVVYGRNNRLKEGIFAFLRAIGLQPIELSKARKLTGKPMPYIGEILQAAFAHAQAVVVLLTPDDEANLRYEWVLPEDPEWERKPTPQARQNVIFEAGMALASHAERTVLVQFGNIRPFSDVSRLHTVRMNNSAAKRKDLAQRLEDAGCRIDLAGEEWLTVGDLTPPPELPEQNPASSESNSAMPVVDETYQLASERWEQLKDPALKEAVRLLLREDLTTQQALNFLHKKGLAMNRVGVYDGIATTTNLVQRVLPGRLPDEHVHGYTGP